jgi:protein TonB
VKVATLLVVLGLVFATRTPGAASLRNQQRAAPQPQDRQPARVEQSIAEGFLEKKVNPVYPEKARQMRIQGTVVLNVLLSKKGKVKEMHVVSGHPLLVPAAMDAVKQWKYKPLKVEGRAVEVETDVVVNFVFQE